MVEFYGISTIVVYLMLNPLYTNISNIYDFLWLDFKHINHCRLFHAKSSLFIYINNIGFGWVEFYGISTIIGYLMLNPIYMIILLFTPFSLSYHFCLLVSTANIRNYLYSSFSPSVLMFLKNLIYMLKMFDIYIIKMI